MSVVDEQVTTPAAPAKAASGNGMGSFIWEIVQTVLLTLLIFMAVRAVVQNFKVEGASMEPSLHSGQYLLINKIGYLRLQGTPLASLVPEPLRGEQGYLFGGPTRGDIVVFRAPTTPDKDFIKRVIAVPGDTVEGRNGQVYVNGEVIPEPYISQPIPYLIPRQTVPTNCYYVLGDNRPNSSDSHVWGCVPAENFVGRAWVSYWPPDLWGVVPEAAYAR